MIKQVILCLILPLLVTRIIAQTGIKGFVTDENDQPVPFATIYLKQTTTGTTTNDLGQYEILLEPGSYTVVFQGLGFKKQEINLIVTEHFVVKNIQLVKQAYRIKEIRVYSGGEDPAYPIMRKAISLAPYYQRQTAAYAAEVYLKGSLKMEKIPKLVKRMMRVEVREDNEVNIEEGKTYTMESMNEIRFSAPDNYDHTIISSQSTFPGNNEDNVIGYITYSFYEPYQGMAISPLASNAFSYYKFVYEGYFTEDNVVVNKIRVIPKRKSQQTYSGYIYIVDNLWSIHSVDVTNKAFFGEITIRQVCAPVKDHAWLPVSHRFNVKASIFGVKAKFHYAGSVKYNSIEINTNLPLPPALKTQYATKDSINENTKTNEDSTLETKTRAQKKMHELLTKEELSNRDMIKLSRLIEKESAKQNNKKHESLEIKDTYKITHKKDTVYKDSLYWDKIRPIPLTSDELKSFEIKDSIKLSKIKADTARVKPKKKSTFNKVSNGLLSGHTFYRADSTIEITYNGLINLSQAGFNAVDGWSYEQGFRFIYNIDSVHHLSFRPKIKYAFNRNKMLWQAYTKYSFAPEKRTYVVLDFGRITNDFNHNYGIDPTLNTISALFFKEHYMKLYQKNYISFNYGTDPIHAMRLNTEISYSQYNQLKNYTNWSIGHPSRYYAPNIPINHTLNNNHLYDQKELCFKISLEYTPRMYYSIHKGRKYMRGSKYPTLKLEYKRGIEGIWNSESDFEVINMAVWQKKSWGIFNEFNWQAGAGYFTRNKQMHFSQFAHFNTNQIPVCFKNWHTSFNLLDDYSVSTNKWYTQAHVSYSSPYLCLKFLPWVSNRLWVENIYVSYLATPHLKNYAEFGYGISQIFFIGNIGVFTGFENGRYSNWGFKMSLNLN